MRMLVAVDLHDHPQEVVREAVGWAERLGAEMDLLFVGPSAAASATLVSEPAVRAVVDEHYQEVRVHARAQLERLLRSVPAQHRGDVHVLEGSPGRLIAELSDRYDAVAVATHGRTGLDHLFLGSVAERVVRTSAVPVLVLRLPVEG